MLLSSWSAWLARMWVWLVLLAAEGGANELQFSRARALAVLHAPEVQLARGREAVAGAEVVTAGAWLNPTLTVSSAVQTSRLSTGVSLPLPIFGQLGVARSAAEADLKAARADSQSTEHQSRCDASEAWIDLWEAQGRSALLDGAARDADRLADVASQRFQAGTAPQVDVVRARADRARAHAEATTQASVVGAAAARLQLWLGPAPPGGWTAVGEWGFEKQPPALEAIAGRLTGHPTLRRDGELTAAARAHVKSEERQRLPLVEAQLTVAALDPTLPGPDVIGGLAFELPILSQRSGPVSKARAEQALAERQAEADRLRLEAALSEAHLKAVASAERVTSFEKEVVPSAEQARAMTEEGYRDGRVDLLRLLEAQRAVVDARLAALEAKAAYGRAMVELERASGVDLLLEAR